MWISTAKTYRPVFLIDIKWLLSVKYVPACTVTFSLVKGSKITRDSMTSLVVQIKKEAMPASYTSHLTYRLRVAGMQRRDNE
jgi:hypothetical protein